MNDPQYRIHVNLPFRKVDRYLDRFLAQGLNPEIGLDAEALDRFDASDFKRVAQLFRDRRRSVTLHGPFMDLAAGSTDPAVRRLTRRRLAQVLPLIPLFSPEAVVCHAGFDRRRHNYHVEEWCDMSAQLWSWFADRLHDAGTGLALENVYESGPGELMPLLGRLDPQRVGVCLDTGHQSAFGAAPLQEWLDRLGDRIVALHLHDNHGRHDDHLALGRGAIDFTPLWAYLRDRNPAVWPIFTLEPHQAADLAPSMAELTRQLGRLSEQRR
jgi:sugar phosphate isomerase/epimerase